MASVGFDAPGFSFSYDGETWREFVGSGQLGRTLLRMCMLVEPVAGMSFVVEPSTLRVDLTRGAVRRVDVAFTEEERDDDALSVFESVVSRINDALDVLDGAPGAHGSSSLRFGVEGSRRTPRVVLAGALHGLRDVDAVVPLERRMVDGGSYPALLARHVERLAELAGVTTLRCRPVGGARVGAPLSAVSLRIETREGPWTGGLTETVTVREANLQPVLDLVNRRLAERSANDGGLRLFRCLAPGAGEHVILASPAEAEELRRGAYLLEDVPGRDVLARLENAGFALPSSSGDWSWWTGDPLGESSLARTLTRACLLAAPHGVSHALRREHDGAHTVEWRAGERTAACTIDAAREDEPTELVLGEIFRAANELLATAGIASRFLLTSGEPVWHGVRLLLVTRPWLEVLIHAPGAQLACLLPDEAAMAAVAPPTRHPARAVEDDLPRVPRVDEIVPVRRVLVSDFKCSARREDFPSVVRELARFAYVRVRVDTPALHDAGERHYAVGVTHEGEHDTLWLVNRKYADVSPILRYLNALLELGDAPERLHLYAAEGYASGVVLASPEESARLRDAGYLVELTPPLADVPLVVDDVPHAESMDVATMLALPAAEQESLVKASASSTAALANVATERLLAGDYDRALALYDVVVCGRLHPMSAANPLYAVQDDNHHQGVMRERAQKYLDACLPHADANPAVFINAAGVQVELGQYDEAVRSLARAVDAGFEGVPSFAREPAFAPLRGRDDFEAIFTAKPSYPVALRRFQTLLVTGSSAMPEHAREAQIAAMPGTLERAHDVDVFARTTTEGVLGFLRETPDAPLERAPVVYVDDEGDVYVYATDLTGFFAVFAHGYACSDTQQFEDDDAEVRLLDADEELLEALVGIDPEVETRSATEEVARARALTGELRNCARWADAG